MTNLKAAFSSVFALCLCASGCGDDETPPSAPDASNIVDAGARDSGKPLTRDAAVTPRDAEAMNDSDRMVTIRFRPEIAGKPFDCDATYDVPGLGRVTPADFKFYVESVALIDASGAEVPVKLAERAPQQIPQVALIDFETASGGCASGTGDPATNMEVVGTVPRGEYRGIVFTNSVPEELNHDDPTTFPPPLQNFGMWWDWFQGFKFLVAEFRRADSDPSASEDAGVAPAQSILHVGSVGCSANAQAEISCSIPNRNRVRLTNFDPDKNVIVADLAGVFADTDARTETFCHGGRASCAKVYRNIGLDLSNGLPTETQRVYRVE